MLKAALLGDVHRLREGEGTDGWMDETSRGVTKATYHLSNQSTRGKPPRTGTPIFRLTSGEERRQLPLA